MTDENDEGGDCFDIVCSNVISLKDEAEKLIKYCFDLKTGHLKTCEKEIYD